MNLQFKYAGKSLANEKDVFEVIQIKPPDVLGEIRYNARRGRYTFVSYGNTHFDETSLSQIAQFLSSLRGVSKQEEQTT